MTTLKQFSNDFEYIEVKNSSCSAKIALNGAHLFEYKRNKFDDLLWLSKESDFKIGSAIRGGIPICWPSFGMNNPSLTQHGFARTSIFELISTEELSSDTTQIKLRLSHSPITLEKWNYKFQLDVIITLNHKLTIELKTTNLDLKEFTITEALHTYFNVSNISDVVISDLDKKVYFDALTQKDYIQDGDITFDREFDVVFQNIKDDIVLKDKNRVINIKNDGASSAVVWNPWIEKCSKMSAMSSDAYKEFVCIESANAYNDFVVIKPNEIHILKATFTTI